MHEVQVKGILSAQNGMNIYRGCSHGCIYCDARSTCYQMKHDFEDIEVKVNAPQLLEKALKSKRKKLTSSCQIKKLQKKQQQNNLKLLTFFAPVRKPCFVVYAIVSKVPTIGTFPHEHRRKSVQVWLKNRFITTIQLYRIKKQTIPYIQHLMCIQGIEKNDIKKV